MQRIFVKMLIILTPFLLYQLFFCYLIDILLHIHKDVKPTVAEYMKIISYNLVFMLFILVFTLINLKLINLNKDKLLVTCYILLVGIMGWVIDVLSALNSDIINGLQLENSVQYIAKQSRSFLLALGAILFYWFSPWTITSKKEGAEKIEDENKKFDIDKKHDQGKKSWW